MQTRAQQVVHHTFIEKYYTKVVSIIVPDYIENHYQGKNVAATVL